MRQLKIVKSITNRESYSFEKYLQEIGKVDLLTADEEAQLARKIKAGDQHAADRLIKANLRFVVSVAKQYQFHGIALSDMVNDGNVGLIKAAHRFDESRGFKFISYAVWWIRQSIVQAISEQGRIVRVPSNKIAQHQKIQKAFSQLEQEHERTPTPEELAESLDMNVDDVRFTMQVNDRHVSLDTPVGESGDTLVNLMENRDEAQTNHHLLQPQSLTTDVSRSLHALPPMQKDILLLFFGIGVEPLTLEEIGLRYNLSGERVRQLKSRALIRLKSEKKSLLKSYL